MFREEGHCLACETQPESVYYFESPTTLSVEAVVRCHGRIQCISFPYEQASVARIADTVSRLFPYDASPDMRELLKYNREGWTCQ